MRDQTFSTWLERQFSDLPRVTAKQVAYTAGLSPAYLSGLRSSKRDNPSAEIVTAIAQSFASLRQLNESESERLLAEALASAQLSRSLRGVGAPPTQPRTVSSPASLWHKLMVNK